MQDRNPVIVSKHAELKQASHESTYKSYISLKLTPKSEGGWQTIPIARFGAFEVRLVEFADSDQRDNLVLWIELYRYDTQSSIDSCLCRDLDEVEDLGAYLFLKRRIMRI